MSWSSWTSVSSSSLRNKWAMFLAALLFCFAGGLPAQAQDHDKAMVVPEGQETHSLGLEQDLDDLILVKSSQGRAVVRFGTGPLVMISVEDRLGRNQAEVMEIDSGRLILEETFTGEDGRPNRARIILRDGERGGKRYLLHPEMSPPYMTRPEVLVPPMGEEKR